MTFKKNGNERIRLETKAPSVREAAEFEDRRNARIAEEATERQAMVVSAFDDGLASIGLGGLTCAAGRQRHR